MSDFLQLLSTERIPLLYVLLAVLFCVAGAVAGGSLAKSFRLSVGALLAYGTLLDYAPAMFKVVEQSGPVPFFACLTAGGDILAMLREDFPSFVQEFFFLFVLVLLTRAAMDLCEPVVTALDLGAVLPLGFLFPWLGRIAACMLGGFLYSVVSAFVLAALTRELALLLAGIIFGLWVLALLSPLAELLAGAAKLAPNPILKGLSRFVQEAKLGQTLQAVFYATFFVLAYTVIVFAVLRGDLR